MFTQWTNEWNKYKQFLRVPVQSRELQFKEVKKEDDLILKKTVRKSMAQTEGPTVHTLTAPSKMPGVIPSDTCHKLTSPS